MSGEIRAATEGDYGAFLVLLRELGVDDPPPSQERFAREHVPRMKVYEREGAVLGYVTYDKLAANGYVRNLVVAPEARGGGVGEALMMAAAEELRALGVAAEWHLNVKADNAPAIRLYERLGMRMLHRSVAVRFAWADVARLPTEPGVVIAYPVLAADVAKIEAALGILGGRLEMTRSRGRGITLQLLDKHLAPVGVACFDPAFPGAFPFCVARPTLAAPLLGALAPHARQGDPALQLVIEHDDALADALLAAGGEERMRLLHLAGPLPRRGP